MAKDRLSGKLAVILHADIAGSTALVQQDEQLAHERIQDAFRRFSETIEKYQGHILELRGDALLAHFERASDAVTATLAFQADHTYLISRLKDDLRPTIRVGIAMGEVVIADDTVTGSGVVLAQRVEQLADPGGVCITAALHETLPKRMPFDLENMGERVLKGFDDPVRVYRVELSTDQSIPAPQQDSQPEVASRPPKLKVAIIVIALVIAGGTAYWFKTQVPQEEPASVENMAYPLPDKPSIAVLPFTNMSDDTEQEYFADGMTEDLITDLSKLSSLLVISRNSTFTYKGKSVKVEQVARELGVRYVLEGSVRRAANQVRINAQLIDGTTGGHLWAERYDGSIDDVFALQDRITKRIVKALSVTLTPQETERLQSIETKNTAAHDAYLLGLSYYYRDTPKDFLEAAKHFSNAIELDHTYSPARTALAKVYGRTVLRYFGRDGASALGMTFGQAVGKTWRLLGDVEVKPDADFHVVRSWFMLKKRQHSRAIREANLALEINPNSADALEALSEALIYAGKIEEGQAKAKLAMRQNPAKAGRSLYLMGLAEYIKGDSQSAVDLLQKAIERAPERNEFSGILGAAYAELGSIDLAKAAVVVFSSNQRVYLTESLARILARFPTSSRVVLERYAKNITDAGATDSGYLPLYAENRLNGTEIRSLLFGAEIKGTDFWDSVPWAQTRSTDGQVEHSGKQIITGISYSAKHGVGRIDDDVLCERWPEFNDVGEICVTIFRVPEPASMTARRGDYVMVSDFGPNPFRVVE
jgi:adenylate cyclase